MNDYEKFGYYTDRCTNLDPIYAFFLKKESTDEEKFHLTSVVLEAHNILPAEPPANNTIFDHQSSQNEKDRGNMFFIAGNNVAAILYYTMSMQLAEPGTECHAIALANRSAPTFHMGNYQRCLDDIQRALRYKYPIALAYKLYERAGNAECKLGRGDLAKKNYLECLEHVDKSTMSEELKQQVKTRVTNAITSCANLAAEQSAPKVPEGKPIHEQLLGGKNEKIPALSKFLELKDSKMGRGVFATQDINPGDVVIVDEPCVGGRCSYPYICQYSGCLKVFLNGVFCPNCSLVYYCSEACVQMASVDGHYIECPIMYSFKIMPGNKETNELALRWFLRIFTKMGLDNYCSVVNNILNSTNNNKTRGFDENGHYDSFLAGFSLKNNLAAEVQFFFNCIGVEILHYLTLSGFKIPENKVNLVGASLVRMLNVLYTYSQFGLYPSIGLFNHSCDPNVKPTGELDNRIKVMKAVQHIPKGSQLFITLVNDFKESDKSSRNKCLEKKFGFKCLCEPCLKNWPTAKFIPRRVSALNLLNPSMSHVVITGCIEFLQFKRTSDPRQYDQNLNFLYNFMKLIRNNIKRPFALYEDCVDIISTVQNSWTDELTKIIKS